MSGENLAAVAAEAAEGASKSRAEGGQKPEWATAEENLSEGAGANPPATPPAPEPTEPSAEPDLEAARAEGRAAERAYRNEVEDLCALAGQPERARAFIDAETSVADVRKELLEGRASADAGRHVATQIPATGGSPEKGALARGMKRLVGKEA